MFVVIEQQYHLSGGEMTTVERKKQSHKKRRIKTTQKKLILSTVTVTSTNALPQFAWKLSELYQESDSSRVQGSIRHDKNGPLFSQLVRMVIGYLDMKSHATLNRVNKWWKEQSMVATTWTYITVHEDNINKLAYTRPKILNIDCDLVRTTTAYNGILIDLLSKVQELGYSSWILTRNSLFMQPEMIMPQLRKMKLWISAGFGWTRAFIDKLFSFQRLEEIDILSVRPDFGFNRPSWINEEKQDQKNQEFCKLLSLLPIKSLAFTLDGREVWLEQYNIFGNIHTLEMDISSITSFLDGPRYIANIIKSVSIIFDCPLTKLIFRHCSAYLTMENMIKMAKLPLTDLSLSTCSGEASTTQNCPCSPKVIDILLEHCNWNLKRLNLNVQHNALFFNVSAFNNFLGLAKNLVALEIKFNQHHSFYSLRSVGNPKIIER